MSDLPIDPFRRTRIGYTAMRSLTAEDVASLGGSQGVFSKPLKGLRDSHHLIARLIAQGLANHEIGAQTGYSQSRISILKADPAFQELVEHYRGKVETLRDAVWADAEARAALVRDELLEVMHERISQEPETFSKAELAEWVKIFMDRTGYGPASKSTNVNLNIDVAQRIARGRERAARAHELLNPAGPTIEHEPLSGPGATEYHRVEHKHGHNRDTE